ncbi:uncharacterized protein N7469_000160 [Penicillium citrinum]|uniref:Integral membrane protein n=2 Tax=Penicillium TaxID=5073 RepID=A0A9W9PCG8_PENCI|nr:uncharacterized protein N7469_000160 [Penicillium citrinum]KAJ5241833.1 hypothetical protein N7469_000160 [Penicillium citrinum]KAJ5600672.1 hypothetical protein N7450_001739 [Penicillium hetheringtonii]KAK5807443.1 hypothetical protein VI817_001701 [Penicillium citrinum]
MSLSTSLRLLRLLPAISSTATLQFALDEHLIFGTWMGSFLRPHVNITLPTWWTHGGRRWQWILIIGYPLNYLFGILNLVARYDQLQSTGSTTWYVLGLLFSVGHMLFVKMALGRIAAIEKGVPKDNVRVSMGKWLQMNWVRALITDLPAWICWIMAAVSAM